MKFLYLLKIIKDIVLKNTEEMILRIHPQDAKRILRWIRHATEHVGIFLHRLEELD